MPIFVQDADDGLERMLEEESDRFVEAWDDMGEADPADVLEVRSPAPPRPAALRRPVATYLLARVLCPALRIGSRLYRSKSPSPLLLTHSPQTIFGSPPALLAFN